MRYFSIMFALMLGAFTKSQAQADLQNNGTLYISNSSDILYISGNFTNSSSASLTNNGNLYVLQNLTNDQVLSTPASGRLLLTGSAAQTVKGTQAFKTFNLLTNNARGVVLNNNLDVYGTHTFSNGIISSAGSSNFLIYESGAGYTGEGDNSHVTGWVKKIGSTDFAFPLGNGTVLRKVSVINLSAASEFNATYGAPTPNTSSLTMPLQSMNGNEYWMINKISGGTAQVTLNWDKSRVDFPPYYLTDIRAAYYNGSWTNVGGTATGSTNTTGSITSNVLSSFGGIGIGSTSVIVPVRFINISAERKDGVALITWKTTSEASMHHYEVQRSNDAINFTSVGSVKAQNSMSILDYSYTDHAVPDNKVYYRIKSVENDGTVAYTRIVMLSSEVENTGFTLLSNPVQHAIVLSVHHPVSSVYHYRLVSNSGQTVQEGNFSCTETSLVNIPLSGIPAKGNYHLMIYVNGQQFALQVIVL